MLEWLISGVGKVDIILGVVMCIVCLMLLMSWLVWKIKCLVLKVVCCGENSEC